MECVGEITFTLCSQNACATGALLESGVLRYAFPQSKTQFTWRSVGTYSGALVSAATTAVILWTQTTGIKGIRVDSNSPADITIQMGPVDNKPGGKLGETAVVSRVITIDTAETWST